MQSKIRRISNVFYNFIWIITVILLLGGCLEIIISVVFLNTKTNLSWVNLLLILSIPCLLAGTILFWLLNRLQRVRAGRVLFKGEEVEVIRDDLEDGFFLKKDLEGFAIFDFSDIHSESLMELKYLDGIVFRELKYAIKYDLASGDKTLRLFINKFRNKIIKDRLWWEGEVKAFVQSLLREFQEGNSQKLIDGHFYNPDAFCQQEVFVELVNHELNPELLKAGLKLTEARFL